MFRSAETLLRRRGALLARGGPRSWAPTRGVSAASGEGGLGPLGMVFFGGMVVGTASLGTWQYQRYFEKVQLIREREKMLEQVPEGEALADDLGRTQAHSVVRVEGVYDHEKEMRLRQRGPPTSAALGPGGMNTGPIGEYVITPLRLRDGSTVFINRGWVAAAPGRKERPPVAQPQGRTAVLGVLTEAEKANTFSPPNDPEKDSGYLFWVEEGAMRQYAGLAGGDGGHYVQALEETGEADGLLRKRKEDFMKFSVTPETHAGYAATWFSLAFFGAVLTALRARRGQVGPLPAAAARRQGKAE